MSYSKESYIKYGMRFHELMRMYAEMYEAGEEIKVCESKGNKKVGDTINYSLSPLFTCGGNCRVCLGICYDIKAALFRDCVMRARVRNTFLALYHPDEYWKQIDDSLSRKRLMKPVRFHVGGDIPNYDYLEHLIKLARKHSGRKFWTYTKQYSIVNRWIAENGPLPDNLTIMFSVWRGLDCDNPYNMPTFTCVMKDQIWPDDVFQCPGNCQECIKSGRGCVAGESSAVWEH